MKNRAIILIPILFTSFLAYAEPTNIIVPDVPSIQFLRMDNPFERLHSNTINKPFTITADGTGFLQITTTVSNPFPCGEDPQGNPSVSCMENRDDPNQKIYFQLQYKPCGGIPTGILNLTKSDAAVHTVQMDQTRFNPSICSESPTNGGYLNFVRIKFLGTQPQPLSGIYLTTINLTVSAV